MAYESENLINEALELVEPLVKKIGVNPEIIGLSRSYIDSLDDQRRRSYLVGEALAFISQSIGPLASHFLLKSQWLDSENPPEWFDHRHTWLNPDQYNHDFADSSVYNVLPHLPLDGSMLSLCCGDGFFEKHFYSKRCSKIIAIDANAPADPP